MFPNSAENVIDTVVAERCNFCCSWSSVIRNDCFRTRNTMFCIEILFARSSDESHSILKWQSTEKASLRLNFLWWRKNRWYWCIVLMQITFLKRRRKMQFFNPSSMTIDMQMRLHLIPCACSSKNVRNCKTNLPLFLVVERWCALVFVAWRFSSTAVYLNTVHCLSKNL